jgi:hypothetical protein
MLPDIHRKIVNAKYVFERSIQIQTEANGMSFSISLLLMHDAIEMLMIAVLDHLKIAARPKREFMDFWNDVKQAGFKEPSDFIPMQSLNKLRVGLKHNGNLPNPPQVKELTTRTEGFFDNVLSSYCSISYESVSLIDLVPQKEIRDVLVESKRKFSGGEVVPSLIDLKVALHKLENPSGGMSLSLLRAPSTPSFPDEMRGLERHLDHVHAFMQQTATRVNAIMLGVDPIRYTHFVTSTPSLLWNFNGTAYQAQIWGSYDRMTLAMYDEFLLFLIEYAMRVSEAYVPTVVRYPLNRKHQAVVSLP